MSAVQTWIVAYFWMVYAADTSTASPDGLQGVLAATVTGWVGATLCVVCSGVTCQCFISAASLASCSSSFFWSAAKPSMPYRTHTGNSNTLI